MSDSGLGVELREIAGKGVARKLRAAGRIPGVCYGRDIPSASIVVDPRALEQLIATSELGVNTLIDLSVQGGGDYDGRKMLIKDLQRDPVGGNLLHADFYAVDLRKTIEVEVPIHLSGTPEGVTMGGILDQNLRELVLECLPQSIPNELLIDVSGLNIGDSLHVRDIEIPGDVKLMSDPELSVVSVMQPAVEEEPTVSDEAVEGEGEGEAPAEGEEGKSAEGSADGDKSSKDGD